MVEIVAGLVAVLLIVICACVIYYSNRRIKAAADEVIRKANCLSADMDVMDGYLMEIREQINRLSNTLDEIERDVESKE